MAQSSLVAKLQAASTCGDEVTHQDRFTNDPHGFPEMIAEWEETVKKYAEQAESQNDNLAEDKELCALKQSAEAGIKTRSKEYAAMLRKMTPEQENAYQSTKGTSAKAQFRLDWAKEQYALAKKSRVEKQSWKEADADIGEYKVLAKIVEDEGFAVDAPGAFKRAQSITSKCAQLGGKWIHFDVMRNELTFLHVRKQHNHTFEHAWNLFTTEGQSSAKSNSAEKPACSSTVTDKPAGAETPAQSAGRGTKRTTKHDEDDRAKAKARATPRPSPKKSRALPQHQAASLVRTRYHEAVACSTTLISAVEKDPEWMWANTEHMLGDLKKHVKTMSDLVDMNTRLFLIGMPNDDLAKRVGNDAFDSTIRTVENELGPVVDRVITQCARMTNAHVELAKG